MNRVEMKKYFFVEEDDDSNVNYYIIPGNHKVCDVGNTITKDNYVSPMPGYVLVAVKNNGICTFNGAELVS